MTSRALSRIKHPYHVRIGGRVCQFASDYDAALAAFHFTAKEEADDREVSVWMRSDDGRDVWLISLANPFPPQTQRWAHREYYREAGISVTKRDKPPAYVNLFAGLVLAPTFFLDPATRRQLDALGWPAPPDAVSWRYAQPTEMEPEEAAKEVIEEAVEQSPPTEEQIAAVDAIDIDAFAADPACRVDAEALRRRLLMGWPLERAMSTPMLGYKRGEAVWFVDSKTRRRRTVPESQRPSRKSDD